MSSWPFAKSIFTYLTLIIRYAEVTNR
jgi:hypothetical protein